MDGFMSFCHENDGDNFIPKLLQCMCGNNYFNENV